MAIVDDEPRIATIKALEDCRDYDLVVFPELVIQLLVQQQQQRYDAYPEGKQQRAQEAVELFIFEIGPA